MLRYSDDRRANKKQCKKYKHLILSIIGMYLLIAAFCIYLSNINHEPEPEPEPNHSSPTTRQPLLLKPSDAINGLRGVAKKVGISVAPTNSKQTLVRDKSATIGTILEEIVESYGNAFDHDIHKIQIYNKKEEPVPYDSIPKDQPISQLNLLSRKGKLRYKIFYKISINLQAKNDPEYIYIDPDEKLGNIAIGNSDVVLYDQKGQRLDPSKSAKENGINDGYATIWLNDIPVRVEKGDPETVVADIMIPPNSWGMTLKPK